MTLKPEERTSLQVSKETRKRIRAIGKKHRYTIEDLINILIDRYEHEIARNDPFNTPRGT